MRRGAALLFFVTFWTCAVCAQRRITTQEYIDQYKALAILDQEVYGIPASITMAQGLLESDCGNSRLAVEANNHFGIKCKRDWTGESILHDDDALGECFRKYASAEESYRDHSEFLDKSPRYGSLFDLEITDYKAWAHGLKSAGYATNPKYAELLIKIIEENGLHLLDAEQVEVSELIEPIVEMEDEPEQPQDAAFKIDVDNYVVSLRTLGNYALYHNNGSEFVVARSGDTYETLAVKLGIKEKKLRALNDAPASLQPAEGDPVYVLPKAGRANNGKVMHLAKPGENLRFISQKYGVKLKKLAAMNRLPADAVLRGGQQIRLM